MASQDLVDKQFIEHVVARMRLGKKDDVKIKSWTVQPAVNKGENYSSTLSRVTVEIEDEPSVSLVVKSFPDGPLNALVQILGIWDKEEKMYEVTLPRIHELLGRKVAADGVQVPGRRDIVLEDLRSGGFKMVDRLGQLDFEHSVVALKTLANFHAGSVAVREIDKENIDFVGRELYFKERKRKEHCPYVKSPLVALANEAENWPECKGYSAKLKGISDLLWDGVVYSAAPKGFNVLNHGDFWSNNIMFKYNDSGEISEARLVDFQNCRYTTPAMDIQNFFISSVQEQVREERCNELLDAYLETLNATLAKLGQATLPKPLFDEQLRSADSFALYAAATALPSTLSDSENPLDFTDSSVDDFVDPDSTKNPFARTLKGKRYRRVIPRLLADFDRKGLFDEAYYSTFKEFNSTS